MPIVEVEVILRPAETLRDELAQELADALGEALNTASGTTWVKVDGRTHNRYAESGGMTADTFPVFVTILKSSLPALEARTAEAERVTACVSRICERPSENVHIIYLPEGKGRVAFGGDLVR